MFTCDMIYDLFFLFFVLFLRTRQRAPKKYASQISYSIKKQLDRSIFELNVRFHAIMIFEYFVRRFS